MHQGGLEARDMARERSRSHNFRLPDCIKVSQNNTNVSIVTKLSWLEEKNNLTFPTFI